MGCCLYAICKRFLPILIVTMVFSVTVLSFNGSADFSEVRIEELLFTPEDFGLNVLYYRFQARSYAKEFKLIDYPISEFGVKVDARFFEGLGFKRSVAQEADLGEYKFVSIIFLFRNSSGAKAAYEELISFLSWRRTYDSFPYLWVPKWDNVEDIANHFITALYNNHPKILCGLGEEASHFYDPLNNFHYTIFRFNRLLFMVGVIASEEKMLEYARKIEHKLIELWLKTYF